MNDETKIRFDAWLKNIPQISITPSREVAQMAWYAAVAGQLEKAEATARAALRKQLTTYAVESFLERDHTRARFFLDLADERHALWEETT